MATVSERSQEISKQLIGCDIAMARSVIEQALLAERRLAMESLSNYLRHVGSCRFTFDGQKDSCTCGLFEALRAAAEKEVGK